MDVVTLSERPDLDVALERLDATWPRFYEGSAIPHGALDRLFPDYQSLLLDEGGSVLAAARSFPLAWDRTVDGLPEGLEHALMSSADHPASGGETVCAYSIVVDPARRGEHLSARALRAMAETGERHGHKFLVAPVRPSWKSRYPLTPIDSYLSWHTAEGLAFDPWVRVHQRLGAKQLRVAPRSMVCRGTVGEWESWTGMAFPESNRYVVPDALEPVSIDCAKDVGLYEEPNLWMVHTIASQQ